MPTSEKRCFKEALYEQFARIGRALANPHRLELLDLLAQGERTVEDLARETGLSVANVSQHLQILRGARLVDVRRSGLYAYYRLADPHVFSLWRSLRTFGETRLAEIQQVVASYFNNRDSLQAITLQELKERLAEGNVIVIDVRPYEEYLQGHIPAAKAMPLEELERRLQELPRDQEIVAYCRGPYCVFADEAVALLKQHGFKALRLSEGLPDWQDEGLPIEVGGESR
ncbi:ArsR/SmtB family transcription factor [Chthonomonas calidirosea]|uniref:ArsR/SmtB family transcription factor n=1 Tax=Chthonomonas calidirosea TaxID=454171 RepID=UPI0006ECA3B7|nr:metalloregulator ArsR/SmtB family transcription factor [Chthonomonas calidirosea]CEK19281.1 transcriptional regulator, ArsR family [Chthonomonas calidirosea]